MAITVRLTNREAEAIVRYFRSAQAQSEQEKRDMGYGIGKIADELDQQHERKERFTPADAGY